MVWSSARRKIYLHIDLSRCISLYFLSASVALNILSVYQLFHDFENFMSLFGRFQFLEPTCFLEVIYPRYNPDTIIINWNMRNISTHSWCLFLFGICSKIEVEKQEFPAFPMKPFEKTLFLEFDILFPILNEGQGESWASHTKTHCGHSCCNENFQILLTFDLHRLANDANENHNYIACCIIL